MLHYLIEKRKTVMTICLLTLVICAAVMSAGPPQKYAVPILAVFLLADLVLESTA